MSNSINPNKSMTIYEASAAMSEQDQVFKQERALAQWRDSLSTSMLRVISVLALPALLSTIGMAAQPAATPLQRQLSTIYALVFCAVLALAWLKNIRYGFKAWAILVLFYGLGALSLAVAGLGSNGRLFTLITPMIATILLGARGGIAVLLLCLGTLAGFGWGLSEGSFSLMIEDPAMSTSLSTWVRTVAVNLLLCAAVMVPLVHLLRGQMFAVELSVKNAALQEATTQTRSAMERAKEATRAKSAFVANMSHELRTPLNGVLGMTELLLSSNLEAEQQELAKTLQGSGEALLAIINDILDFSKIESGRLELERAPFDLRNCVEETLDLMASAAERKGLSLLYEAAPEVPQTIEGDSTRMRQILLNLVGNAVKFTPEGEVRVAISRSAQTLEVQVIDTGIGIPKERLQRLFEPFTQADTSTTRHYGGTGLGLTITRQLVELMGGKIWIRSEEGRGSSFCFAIPIEGAIEAAPPAWVQGRSAKVLCSQPSLRHNVIMHLRSLGVREAQDEAPDVVITDTLQPDALETLDTLDALRSQAPLVMLTPFSGLKGHGWTAPPSGVLLIRKPLRASKLLACLRQALQVADETPQAPPQPEPEQTPLRILLAEDNRVNQLVAQKMLGLLGYEAAVVDNGLQALEATAREPFDVVLMDVQMPQLDGLQASRRIRAQQGAQPWIIAMTANAQPQDRAACLAAGMNDYLSKPVRREALQRALKRASKPQQVCQNSMV